MTNSPTLFSYGDTLSRIRSELEKSEAEKALFLSLSYDIARARDKDALLEVLNRELKKLIRFTHTLITVIEDAKTTFSNAVEPIIEAVLKSDRPLLLPLDELSKTSRLPDILQINYDTGIKEVAMVALKGNKEAIGFLALFSDKKNNFDQYSLTIIHGVASLISIAVSNIIANEDIKKREEENNYLQQQIETNYNYSEIIGAGPQMQSVYQLISRVASSGSTVLILGDTGTGKELIARAIHNSSPRKDKLMVKVNCAALPANLIESELFGHERGSFTGATDRRIGKFELANNSTLFLDEIGEMPPELQVKLLRALQEREIERIGGKTTIKVDVRIIAATNRDLQKEIKEGRFRSDLYYRLNVFPITMPALKNRKEDIPLLASHFINRYARSTGRNITGISHKATQDLVNYTWPGNVRELEHLIERSILMTSGPILKDVHVPLPEREPLSDLQEEATVKTIDENERDHILKVIKKCKGKIAGAGGAADLLRIPPSTLNSKMLKLGITKEQIFQK